ncbi:MAG: hypothetical protein R3Y59_05285 [bacterium]
MKKSKKRSCSFLAILLVLFSCNNNKSNSEKIDNNSIEICLDKNNNTSDNLEKNPNYNYYDNAGFAIDKSYNLEVNDVYIQMYNQMVKNMDPSYSKPVPKLIAALQCCQNANSSDMNEINLININISECKDDMDEILDEYKVALKQSNIKYAEVKWQDMRTIEYYHEQNMGEVFLPTMASYGYKGNKLFLIQLGSLSKHKGKFEALKNSIIIL